MMGFVASPFLFLAVFENAGRLHEQMFSVALDALELRRIDARYTFGVAGLVVALAVIICVIVERIMTLRVHLHTQRLESAGLSTGELLFYYDFYFKSNFVRIKSFSQYLTCSPS